MILVMETPKLILNCISPRNHERITNEVNALKLISQRTTIPVPKIIDYGYYEDGRRYLVTELIEGVTLKDIQQLGCSKPMGQKHTLVTPCKTCSDQAYASALQFIEDHVLPQLAMLKAKERGIDGFVMPPSWLSPIYHGSMERQKVLEDSPSRRIEIHFPAWRSRSS
jgi:hypothetical protein